MNKRTLNKIVDDSLVRDQYARQLTRVKRSGAQPDMIENAVNEVIKNVAVHRCCVTSVGDVA